MMSVTVTLSSHEIARQLIGHAVENVDEFVRDVEVMGGIENFIDGHEIYAAMEPRHRKYCQECYENLKVRAVCRLVRLTVEDEGIAPEGTWQP